MKLAAITGAAVALLSAAFAQQGVLSNGNSQLPACAASCQVLNQAAQACGGVTSATQAVWACFCQSAYLTQLRSSDAGVCDAYCPAPADSQQLVTWYSSNCGSDLGASEHGDQVSSSTTSTATSAAAGSVSASGAALPSTTNASGQPATNDSASASGTSGWWSTHWKWVVMLIVIFVGLLLIAVVAVVLKRRHDRRQDQIPTSFNAGITTRPVPKAAAWGGTNGSGDTSQVPHRTVTPAPEMLAGSERQSPARTREAFMPYGYGYARSESRLASPTNVTGRKSPLARGGTPVGELEKEVGRGPAPAPGGDERRRQRRVLVRERSVRDRASTDEKT